VAHATLVLLCVSIQTVTHGFIESYSCFSLPNEHSLSHSTLTFGCVMTYFLTSSGKSNIRLGNFSESSCRSTSSGGLPPFKYTSTMSGMFLTSSIFNLTKVFSGSDMAIYTSYVMRIYHFHLSSPRNSMFSFFNGSSNLPNGVYLNIFSNAFTSFGKHLPPYPSFPSGPGTYVCVSFM